MASRLALHSALASSSQPVTVRVQRSRRAEQQSTLEQRAVEFLAFEETLEDLDQIALQMARDETIVAPETVIGEKNRRRATRNRDRYMSGTCVLVQLSYSCSTCIREMGIVPAISATARRRIPTPWPKPSCEGNKWSDEISRVIRPQIMTK